MRARRPALGREGPAERRMARLSREIPLGEHLVSCDIHGQPTFIVEGFVESSGGSRR